MEDGVASGGGGRRWGWSHAQAQETKQTLGMSGWTGFAPLTLADKVGIFKKERPGCGAEDDSAEDRHPGLARLIATTGGDAVAWNTSGVPIVQIFQLDSRMAPMVGSAQ